MATTEEIKTILEQLLTESRAQRGWEGVQTQPVQSATQMAAGLVDVIPPVVTPQPQPSQVDPLFLQRQHLFQMQQMEALQTQQMRQQMSVSAFAQGIPGAAAPSSYMQSPQAVNYQLQSMYQMNPYMANFFAQSQGGPTMNLAPAQFATPARLGVLRPMEEPSQGTNVAGMQSIMRDLVTINAIPGLKRSYAAYEDPIDARIQASRNLTRVGENIAGQLATIAPTVAAFLPGVGLPLGVALEMTSPFIGATVGAYHQRVAEAERVQAISQEISTNVNSSGFRGRGFGLGESVNMVRQLRAQAASDIRYNVSDYMQVLEEGTRTGLMSYMSSPENTMKKVKDIIDGIDVFMRLAGDPDVKTAMDRMGTMQNLGITPNNMQSAAASMRSYARLAGTTVDNLMSTSGAYGAQIAAQTGAAPMFGMQVGAAAPGAIRVGMQTGAFTPGQLAMLGGPEGAAQSLTQMILNQAQSSLGNAGLIPFINVGADNKTSIDQDKFLEYLRSGQIPGGGQTLIEAGKNKLGSFGLEAQKQIMMDLPFLTGQALNLVKTPEQMIQLSRNIVSDLERVSGLSRKEALYSQFGDQAVLIQQYMSDDNLRSARAQYLDSMRTVEATRRATAEANASFFNRAMRWTAEKGEEVFDFMLGDFIQGRAEIEQRRAEAAAGRYLPSGILSPYTQEARKGLKFDEFTGDPEKQLEDFIKRRETPGGRPMLTPQKDNKYWMIGFGQNLRDYPITGPAPNIEWTPEQATDALRSEIGAARERAVGELGEAFSNMNINQQNALTSFYYNAGSIGVRGGDRGQKILELFKSGKTNEAFRLLERHKIRSNGAISPGLVTRRKLESQWGLTPLNEAQTYGMQDIEIDRETIRNLAFSDINKDFISEYIPWYDRSQTTRMQVTENMLSYRDAYVEAMSVASNNLHTKNTVKAREDAMKLMESGTLDFEAFAKMPIRDRAAVFDYAANTERKDIGTQRLQLNLDSYAQFLNTIDAAKVESQLKKIDKNNEQIRDLFDLDKDESKGFANIMLQIRKASFAKNMSREEFSKLAGGLLSKDLKLTAGDAQEIFDQMGLNVSGKETEQFLKDYMPALDEFFSTADSDTSSRLAIASKSKLERLTGSVIEDISFRERAKNVLKAPSVSSPFSAKESAEAYKVPMSQDRYLQLGMELTKDMNLTAEERKKEAADIANAMRSSDQMQVMDKHLSGGGAPRITASNTTEMVQLLRSINENLRKANN